MRKKKKLYDGRTRVAKKFIERILKQREARKVTEEVELDEYDKKELIKKSENQLKVGGKSKINSSFIKVELKRKLNLMKY